MKMKKTTTINENKIFVNNCILHDGHANNHDAKNKDLEVKGEFVELEGERYYQIANYHKMPPFFMSIVSDSDHWMFISSNGACTAGRKNPDHALFPYYTDDRIHDSVDITGSKTILLVTKSDKNFLWEPFSSQYEGIYEIKRNLYKNVYGNKLCFEEENIDLGLVFRYYWLNSEKFGLVKRSTLINKNEIPVKINLLDGIQNLLPYGIERRFQLEYSTLGDGYKRNELEEEYGLGIYTLSSIPVDKPEPSEALRATIAWSVGMTSQCKYLLSSRQLDNFRQGISLQTETDVRAARGAYFVNSEFTLAGISNSATINSSAMNWYIVADIDKDSSAVVALTEVLSKKDTLISLILEDVERGTENLKSIVGSADGLQLTADSLSSSRHFSNVLFNVMRGGIPADPTYKIESKDFISFVKNANIILQEKYTAFWDSLPITLSHQELSKIIAELHDPGMEKLFYEYLPITFSRRHGDPSRPWNFFSIDIKDQNGERTLNYQGNWRDLFQNWEALALSYPEYVEGMISKFVNASTADGYNPYRVTRDGFDWEVIDPHDPWSFIGYWGDHQIIYLLKLLEISHRYHPGRLQNFLSKEIFTYANVPYRIKPYTELVNNPRETILFDAELNRAISERVKKIGGDGKFVFTTENNCDQMVQVNLTEKLLLSLLTKLSNFIPEAGIWLNTQRPEWNDANNALVGYGVSMVTLYHLRRYVDFFREICNEFLDTDEKSALVTAELFEFFSGIYQALESNQELLKASISDKYRKSILDQLGTAGSNYRQQIYKEGFSTKRKELSISKLNDFLKLVLNYIDHSISANYDEKGHKLYHSYNLIKFKKRVGEKAPTSVRGAVLSEGPNEIEIQYLPEMLEGQVAVLNSGYLSTSDTLKLLDALRISKLYRADQNSYLLYPDRELSRFMKKNNIPSQEFSKSELLKMLVEIKDQSIVSKDVKGEFHFNSNFRNAKLLKNALINLKTLNNPHLNSLIEKDNEINTVLNIYEQVFAHRFFTGRSGSFYKYEGLGCIYWHMVSKLLLAVQESVQTTASTASATATVSSNSAQHTSTDEQMVQQLINHYYEIRKGTGGHKSPAEYGAFPTDPYSHTPGYAGAQQPGMTGQVKEDIISRFGELGVWIENGNISFRPYLLQNSEFLNSAQTFNYIGLVGSKDGKVTSGPAQLELPASSMAFTIMQVPVIYKRVDLNKSAGHDDKIAKKTCIVLNLRNGRQLEFSSLTIDTEYSSSIFKREGEVKSIEVYL